MPTLTQRAHGDVQTSVGKLGSSSSKVSMTATHLDFGNRPQNALEIKVPKWYFFVGATAINDKEMLWQIIKLK